MRNNYQTKKSREYLSSLPKPRLLTLGFAILIILISFPLVRNIRQRREANQEIKNLQLEINRVQGQNKDLNSLIGYLQSDQFVEEQARLNLNLKKPGEKVLVIKELGNTASSTSDERDASEISNWRRWLNYFLKE